MSYSAMDWMGSIFNPFMHKLSTVGAHVHLYHQNPMNLLKMAFYVLPSVVASMHERDILLEQLQNKTINGTATRWNTCNLY